MERSYAQQALRFPDTPADRLDSSSLGASDGEDVVSGISDGSSLEGAFGAEGADENLDDLGDDAAPGRGRRVEYKRSARERGRRYQT